MEGTRTETRRRGNVNDALETLHWRQLTQFLQKNGLNGLVYSEPTEDILLPVVNSKMVPPWKS